MIALTFGMVFTFCVMKRRQIAEAIAIAAVTVTFWLYLLTELLSCFEAINQKNLLIIWGITDLFLLVILIRQYRKKNDFKIFQTPLVRKDKIILILLGCFFIFMTALAVMTVPYNWDSMCYHLSRIAHWRQDGSVAHYATNDLRQLASPPLAEFVNLHIYTIWNGNDQFLNLLQCGSYIANTVLVYGIAGKLGAGRKYAFVGVLLFISTPIVFAEALSTQVDEFAAVWMLIFVYYLIDFIRQQGPMVWTGENTFKLLILGMCIGFGYLVKPSVLVGMLIFAFGMLLVRIYRKNSIWILLSMTLMVAGISILIMLPEMIRNIGTFGSIMAPVAGERQLIGTKNPLYILLDCIKNIAYNLPNIYMYNGSSMVMWFVYKCAGFLNLNLDNPVISEDGRMYQLNDPQNYGHDSATNPVITIIFLITFLFTIIRMFNNRKHRSFKLSDIYTMIAGISFIVFSAVVRWEPFVTRYMLSYFALLCPAVCVQLQNLSVKHMKRSIGTVSIIGFLCISELFAMCVYHETIAYRQLQNRSRAEGYYYYNDDLVTNYDNLSEYLKLAKLSNLGLYISATQYEYPIWTFLNKRGIQIEAVQVENESKKYYPVNFEPDKILVVYMGDMSELTVNGIRYTKEKSFGNNIFVLGK